MSAVVFLLKVRWISLLFCGQDASQAAQSSRAAVKPVSLTVSTSAGSATPPVTLIPSVSKPGKLTILQAAPLQNPSSNRQVTSLQMDFNALCSGARL